MKSVCGRKIPKDGFMLFSTRYASFFFFPMCWYTETVFAFYPCSSRSSEPKWINCTNDMSIRICGEEVGWLNLDSYLQIWMMRRDLIFRWKTKRARVVESVKARCCLAASSFDSRFVLVNLLGWCKKKSKLSYYYDKCWLKELIAEA